MAKGFNSVGHLLIIGSGKQRIGDAAHDFDIESLHFEDFHFLSPQVYLKGTPVVMIPHRHGNSTGIVDTLIGIIGSVPVDFLRDILVI